MRGLESVKLRDAAGIAFRSAAVVIAVGLAVGGCSGGDDTEGGPPGGAPGGGPGGAPRGMPVDVVAARLDTVVDAIGATGQIEAVQAIDLRPEISGRLIRILAREGTEVRAGTALFKIDDAELLSQVARLEADRDLAEQALARTRELIERDASSKADLELAEASFRSAEAQLQLQQTRTTVRSRRVCCFRSAQQITFGIASVPDRVFEGTVDFVDPRVQLPGRTITVKAQVSNVDRALKPGMFLEARLATEVRPQAVVVPEDAILPLQGADYVWTVNAEGMAERVEVTLGVRTPGWVEVLSGVEVGTLVVVGGIERMSPGAPLTPNVLER